MIRKIDSRTARVAAWRNTAGTKTTGTTFGVKLGFPLRNAWVDRDAPVIELELEGGLRLLLSLHGGFWHKCPEFKHPEIAQWMRDQKVPVPWPKEQPPKFEMERLSGKRFKIRAREGG